MPKGDASLSPLINQSIVINICLILAVYIITRPRKRERIKAGSGSAAAPAPDEDPREAPQQQISDLVGAEVRIEEH